MADRHRDPGLGQYLPPVVAARSVPGEPDDTGEVVDLVPILQVGPVCVLVHTGPHRGAIVRFYLQEVGKGLVELDIKDRGFPGVEGAGWQVGNSLACLPRERREEVLVNLQE